VGGSWCDGCDDDDDDDDDCESGWYHNKRHDDLWQERFGLYLSHLPIMSGSVAS